MNIKEFFKPSVLKIFIFIIIAIFYLYFAGETGCGAGFGFSLCYKAYGFPFFYAMTGDEGIVRNIAESSFLGNYFSKFGILNFNALALLVDVILIYSLACIIGSLLNVKGNKNQDDNS